jgi:hypothetical protein
MQFAPSDDTNSDGPDEPLRIVFQEELADQMVFLGSLPITLFAVRSDPGTPLDCVLNAARGGVGCLTALWAPWAVRLLKAVGAVGRRA